MGGSPYVIDYSSQFRFPVTPDVLWAALGDSDDFETWWGWLTDLRVEGDGLQVGSVLTGVVTPPLPYRMQLRVVVVGCEPGEAPRGRGARRSRGSRTPGARARGDRDDRGRGVDGRDAAAVDEFAARVAAPVLRFQNLGPRSSRPRFRLCAAAWGAAAARSLVVPTPAGLD